MKNFVSLFVMLLVCVGCWIPVASAQNVTFTDSNLEYHVQLRLYALDITMSQFDPVPVAAIGNSGFKSLAIGASDIIPPQNESINSLGGLEHAKNLESLTIRNHSISDLSPLQGLTKLKALALVDNKIRDLTPLANLTNLESLYVGGNDLRAIPPLGNLTKLTTLIINLNPNLGDNIAGLGTLTALETLNMEAIGVRDISPLRNLKNLEELELHNNQIRDISPLQGLTESLKRITLEGNQIRDVSPLTGFMQLTLLKFRGSRRDSQHITNPLSYPSLYTHIPIIDERNVDIVNVPGWAWGLFFTRRVPTTLEVVSGDGQTVGVGEALPEPLVVKVLDGNEERFAGVPVTFAVTEGEGTVDPAETAALDPTYNLRDDEEGEAQTTFTAGESLGQETVVATMTHEDTTFQVTFTINVQPGAIAAPTISTVDPPLPTSVSVRWTAPSYAVQGYELRYRVKDSEAWTDAGHEGTETLFTLTDLIPGTTYEWQLRAETEVGFTPWSPSGFATTGHVLLQRDLVPAAVALDRLVLNEIRNASADRDDWVELKNISGSELSLAGWELSIVAPAGDAANQDVDIVTFPDYTLPAGEVLLITNTAPGETALASGVNIATGARKKGAAHRYLVASGLKLPATRYLLLLRSAVDKNGTSAALEDVAGNYFRETGDLLVEGGTQVWPLQDTERPGDAPPLTEGEAWTRVSTEKRGYVASAWSASGYHDGLGYRRNAEAATSLGTPGYDVPAVTAATPTAQLSVSELMLTTGGSRGGPQWIELYNPSLTAPVNLEGWRLEVEYLDAENARRNRYEGISFDSFTVLPNQTILLTTWHGENSGHFPESRVYHLGFRHGRAFNQRERRSDMLNPLGFSVKLLDAEGALVDVIGNLDGVARTKDEPAWQVPPFETADRVRVSLLRKYEDGAPLPGTEAASWRSAAQVKLVGTTYFGRETDLGTPGYRRGGALPVVLSHFHALQSEAGVVIRWTTESEVDMAGFNVLRSASRAGPFTIINPALIPGAGTSGEKHTYTFTDTASKPGVVSYYRLEEVSLGGMRLPLATTRLKGHVGARGKLTTRWGELKAR